MREFKTVLSPTDFSGESYRALEYAARFARAASGRVLLAHIIHVPSGELYQDLRPVLTFDEAKQRAVTQMNDLRRRYVPQEIACDVVVELGDPYEELMKLARQRRVDLIVTATHGRTGLDHLVMGSVAEKIIRHAPCPVFVVRRGAD